MVVCPKSIEPSAYPKQLADVTVALADNEVEGSYTSYVKKY